ncbi:MAG: hypothetical protein ABF461_04335 [Zymomonas mobilis subsp. pomaceae]|uniref:Uncharacterized protein n=1 Tax=Zymomonas mobilis subsp. pomaceae (strain ATCC 29192 / DSM 22645 / JCM 10191 / CCUG 17912 / NBRC 13757 / NCIMB 11200 / NRRL B-4491 / Barker I) TaxID=579138 RepID=F8ESE6_ZYMMT|nr:hypothetical protein [Zymomonas mobilis]AEI37721.1 hypothetical protein Zymop_0820 [Zymomonas mobilis subsp. pomaceae ATCC 29192]MDX5949088.1 hypothetical protein [Zymomonas mobilis subsp. pomaceae]GEB88893.1 hypothetical protein ZMO02_05300 [Zymomonas mobilis subsp. pomaceae]
MTNIKQASGKGSQGSILEAARALNNFSPDLEGDQSSSASDNGIDSLPDNSVDTGGNNTATQSVPLSSTDSTKPQGDYGALHRHYADQLAKYAEAITPKKPDPNLLVSNPALYAAQLTQYEDLTAKRDQIVQEAIQAASQAESVELARRVSWAKAEHQRLITMMPEWNDNHQRATMVAAFEETGRHLGYNDHSLAHADATDILALKKAHEWRGKAAQWDALQQGKSAAIKAAKTSGKTAQPGTAQPQGASQTRKLHETMGMLRQKGDVHSAAAAMNALFR